VNEFVRSPEAGTLRTAATQMRQAFGAALILLVALPVHRLLGGAQTGYAGEFVLEFVDTQRELLLFGMLLLLAPTILASRYLPPRHVDGMLAGVRRLLVRPNSGAFALGAALVCTALTLTFSVLVLEARPNQIDSVAQLLHARFWAAGMLAGPVLANEFWHIQNSLITEHGWVSQYPPGHVLLLALGMKLGAVWLVGPVLAGYTVYFATRAGELLLPDSRATVRAGALLLAISPFFIALSGSYMNHVTAAAMLAAAAYCAARAAGGGARWAVAAGFAAGYAFTTRPLATLALGSALVLGPWLVREARPRLPRNMAGALAGAAAPLVALAWYNNHFFGAPHRFGYDIALGPSMGLGFGVDPWGNTYGLAEALGWTGADLLTLSLSWLESPVPLVALIGAFLLIAPRLTSGERIVLAAVAMQLAANFLYWHHGIFMGPRMLHEAAPWWLMLGAVSIVRIVKAAPIAAGGALHRYSPRSALAAFCAVGILFGALWLAPQRLGSYGGQWLSTMRMEVPQIEDPAVVFVHDAWIARIAMDLATAGVRLDHVETLIRQNDTCDVAALAAAVREAPQHGAALLARLDLEPRPEPLAPFFAPGSRIRVSAGNALADDCAVQAYADRFGVYDIAPLSWLGDLPGMPATGTIFLRDMGPERNDVALRAFPGRVPLLLAATEPAAPAMLLDYDDGIRLLWDVADEDAADFSTVLRRGGVR
jgi:hypothetical protein